MIGRWGAYLATGLVIGAIAIKKSPAPFPLPLPPTASCYALDGDTLQCGSARVRLVGIDAAELPGHCAPGRNCAPGDALSHFVALQRFSQQPLIIAPIKRDRYNRIVASVTNARGENASCALMLAGASYAPRYDDEFYAARACISEIPALKSIKVKVKRENKNAEHR